MDKGFLHQIHGSGAKTCKPWQILSFHGMFAVREHKIALSGSVGASLFLDVKRCCYLEICTSLRENREELRANMCDSREILWAGVLISPGGSLRIVVVGIGGCAPMPCAHEVKGIVETIKSWVGLRALRAVMRLG
jgi:hypothetical protein